MTTYELTTGTREEFVEVQAQLTADFAVAMLGAELRSKTLGNGYVKATLGNNMENAAFEVTFESGECKKYLAITIPAIGFLSFVDESVAALYDSFVEEHYKLKAQHYKAVADEQRRKKEEAKLEQKHKDNEKKMADMKVQAEKELNKLIEGSLSVSKADEFYYALGWVAKHVGTITAKMPDYLEPAFIKHFGDVEHTTVDSTKVGPAGFTSQWRLSMEASLIKAKEIPAVLNDYLSQNGKKISKTSFVWDLVDKYGFKFGKKQDTLDIMRCVPIEYVPAFNEGFQA